MAEIEIGAVSAVRVHEDEKRVHVDVILTPQRSVTAMFQTPYKGVWIVPEEGDAVEVTEVDGQHLAQPVQNPADYAMPSGMQQGDIAFKVDAGTYVLMQKQGSGDYNIEIEASGDVIIDGIDFDTHTHNFEDSTINDTSDGTGTESTETKTTTGPS